MPKKLHELIAPAIHAEYCYKKAKIAKALENPNSPEFDLLYQMVGAEMARVNPPLILPYVEVCISPQCTLHCRDCANFMQHYDKPKPMDLPVVKSWIDALLESVDHILTFRVMGGEPLMQKQLPQLMEYLIAQGKLQHIQIVTNGTLKPREELVALMRGNTKTSFFFSNYGPKLAPHYQEYVQFCLDNQILVQSVRPDIKWFDMGDTRNRNLSPERLEQVYANCPNNCRHLWNGELHHCPRSAHGKYLGYIKDLPDTHYVDLMRYNAQERRERLRVFYEIPYTQACDHCGFAEGMKLVDCAIQVERVKHKQSKGTPVKGERH